MRAYRLLAGTELPSQVVSFASIVVSFASVIGLFCVPIAYWLVQSCQVRCEEK